MHSTVQLAQLDRIARANGFLHLGRHAVHNNITSQPEVSETPPTTASNNHVSTAWPAASTAGPAPMNALIRMLRHHHLPPLSRGLLPTHLLSLLLHHARSLLFQVPLTGSLLRPAPAQAAKQRLTPLSASRLLQPLCTVSTSPSGTTLALLCTPQLFTAFMLQLSCSTETFRGSLGQPAPSAPGAPAPAPAL